MVGMAVCATAAPMSIPSESQRIRSTSHMVPQLISVTTAAITITVAARQAPLSGEATSRYSVGSRRRARSMWLAKV